MSAGRALQDRKTNGAGKALDKAASQRMSDPAQLRLYCWRRFNTLTAGACANDHGQPDRQKVKAWQAEHGVAADGIVGPKTLAAAQAPSPTADNEKATTREAAAGDNDQENDRDTKADSAPDTEGHGEMQGSATAELGKLQPDFLQMFPYLMKWEGGLSHQKSDAASQHPCPCEHEGRSDWHTNRGVTWSTFQASGPVLGYDGNDCALFFAMPDELVQKIIKHVYWDPVHGDDYQSQAIANIFCQWAWGSGQKGALHLIQSMISVSSWDDVPDKINRMIEEEGEEKVFEALMNHRKEFLLAISEPGSKNAPNRKGWMNRHEYFYNWNKQLLD